MARTVTDVLEQWDDVFYRLPPRRGRSCVSVNGKRAPRSEPQREVLRSPTVLKAAIRSAAKRAPEVMVKISGSSKGAKQLRSHLDYISRNGTLTLENNAGDSITGTPALRDVEAEWKYGQFGMPEAGRKRESLNVVLSMPKGIDRAAVRDAAAEFGRRQFGENHAYVFVAHEDEPHPHVHLCVKVMGNDGTRLNPRKADLQLWREQFAHALRERGVDAAATPRTARASRHRSKSQAAMRRTPSRQAAPAVSTPYPSERRQLERFAALTKELAQSDAEGRQLAVELMRAAIPLRERVAGQVEPTAPERALEAQQAQHRSRTPKDR